MDTQVFQETLTALALSNRQKSLLVKYGELLKEKNQVLNLISRKDIDHVYTHHILHALSLNFFFHFEDGQQVLDIGSGGGIPAIPLAIIFPHTQFWLVDSIGKKTLALEEFADTLQLPNVNIIHSNVSQLQLNSPIDTITARAVAPLSNLVNWSRHLLRKKSKFPSSGYLFFKGGDIHEELSECGKRFRKYDLADKLPSLPYYQEKYLLHAN